MAYLVDTNLFLRLALRNDPQRQPTLEALRMLRSRSEVLCFTPQVLSEFWNVCSRPAPSRGGLGLSPTETERKARLIERYFRVLPDSLATYQEWRRLVVTHSVMGVEVLSSPTKQERSDQNQSPASGSEPTALPDDQQAPSIRKRDAKESSNNAGQSRNANIRRKQQRD